AVLPQFLPRLAALSGGAVTREDEVDVGLVFVCMNLCHEVLLKKIIGQAVFFSGRPSRCRSGRENPCAPCRKCRAPASAGFERALQTLPARVWVAGLSASW